MNWMDLPNWAHSLILAGALIGALIAMWRIEKWLDRKHDSNEEAKRQ